VGSAGDELGEVLCGNPHWWGAYRIRVVHVADVEADEAWKCATQLGCSFGRDGRRFSPEASRWLS
jgi:hypothetical protein